MLTWTYTPNSTSPVPPSITTQPKNQTVIAGQTATFSVVASGTAPLSYQWRQNGSNIPGATSSSYTTAATTSNDNGSTFQAVVTNSVSSATSNSATLTVNSSAPGINYGGGFTSSGLTLNGGGAERGTKLRATHCGAGQRPRAFLSTAVKGQTLSKEFPFQLSQSNA